MAKKISIIGAGAVGATLAQRIIEAGIADVVLVDILKNVAAGKAIDLLDASPVVGHECGIIGTDDYAQVEGSDIVVITAGLPRKPGMTREELISKNAGIVKGVSEKIRKHSPSAIVIVVTNPLDVMTYLALATMGSGRNKVFGMAGVLDGARMAYLIADELKVKRSAVETVVLGSHGETMVPVLSKTRVFGKPVMGLIPKDGLDKIVKRTCDRGAEIVSLLGTGSAFYSPSAAALLMIKAVMYDTKATLTVSALLEGEYGLKDICIGVPCVIGKSGMEKVVEIDLSKEEQDAFLRSAKAIQGSINLL
ncbi:MAG: malate dehydrogenase [Candidatus Omnitrophica bacterium]|nr:malate dehydrogenase [Candidatus Omnitrophota bacterium]